MIAIDRLSLLGKRAPTMRMALSLLPIGAQIIETGCVRQDDNWVGDGMSTVLFAEWARDHGGHLDTVDNDPMHLEVARRLTGGLPVDFHLADSVDFLRSTTGPVDLLYLDSLDYPYGDLLDFYGGRQDIGEAISTLEAMSEAEIIGRHADLISASQAHCQREVEAALHLEPTLVLIDDAGLPGGGKARLAKARLAAASYQCLRDAYQTLWAR